jgi:hypothetical protein
MSNLSALPCFLGFFWMLWDRRKRTWHDMVANSLVVRAGFYPPGEFGRPPRRPAPPAAYGSATNSSRKSLALAVSSR